MRRCVLIMLIIELLAGMLYGCSDEKRPNREYINQTTSAEESTKPNQTTVGTSDDVSSDEPSFEITVPSTSEPEETESSATEPEMIEIPTTEPKETEVPEREPEETESPIAEPVETEPTVTEPSTVATFPEFMESGELEGSWG